MSFQTYTIRTTINPGAQIVVGEEEYLDLLRQGLVYGQAAPGPVDPDDLEVAGFLDNETSQTYARLLAQLGEAVSGSNPFADAQRAALVPRWTASTAVTANQLALAPDGKVIKRNSGGTTRGSYDSTEQALWTVTAGGAGGAIPSATPPASPSEGALWSSTAAPAPVVLTFDDNRRDQLAVLPALAAVGGRATFYMNSGRFYGHSIYLNTYMTIGEAQAIAAAGHEIGGHTLVHDTLLGADRTVLGPALTQDRQNLIDFGLGEIRSFAYPYTQVANVDLVQAAGYTNARNGPFNGSSLITQFGPKNPFAWEGHGTSTSTTTTLAQMQQYVLNAEASATGKPVSFLTHEVGTGGIPLTVLTDFIAWCAERGTPLLTATEVFG